MSQKLSNLEALGVAKAIAAQFLNDDSFSVSDYVRRYSGVVIRGEYRAAPIYRQEKIAARIMEHYVAAMCGYGGHTDLIQYCYAHRRGIMALQYK